MRQLWLTMALTAVMAVGAAEPEGDLRDRDMELLRQLPNLVGLDLDDYYHYNLPSTAAKGAVQEESSQLSACRNWSA